MAASKVAARSGLPPAHLAHPSLHPLWQKGITGCRLFLVRSCYLGPRDTLFADHPLCLILQPQV